MFEYPIRSFAQHQDDLLTSRIASLGQGMLNQGTARDLYEKLGTAGIIDLNAASVARRKNYALPHAGLAAERCIVLDIWGTRGITTPMLSLLGTCEPEALTSRNARHRRRPEAARRPFRPPPTKTPR